MKKLTAILFAMLITASAFAGNPFKITKGKGAIKSIMKDNAKAVVVIDWSQAKFDKKEDLKKKWGDDYDFIVADCMENFISEFNEASQGLIASDKSEDTKYTITIKVTSIDSYFAVMRFIPQHEAKVWGSMNIKLNETGETLTEITIDEAEDGADTVLKECYGETFGKMGKRTAKLK